MGTDWTSRRVFGLAGVATMAAMAGGCATPVKPNPPHVARPIDPGPLVFPTDTVLAFERASSTQPYEWFEYSRNNREVSARTFGPLLATNQWPVPPRPAERRVRFWWWDQKR